MLYNNLICQIFPTTIFFIFHLHHHSFLQSTKVSLFPFIFFIPDIPYMTCCGTITQTFETLEEPSPVTSGALQGTVLGSLLFLLYVNDLPDNLKSSLRLSADDALLYGVISNEEDGDQLQDDLRQRQNMWQSKWQMVFHPQNARQYVFPPIKYPTKEILFFVESNWDRLNVFPI